MAGVLGAEEVVAGDALVGAASGDVEVGMEVTVSDDAAVEVIAAPV